MPDSNIIQIDQNLFETKLDRLVTEKMTQILNAMLDAEADEITGAARYERKEGRKAYRAGHYERTLTAKAGRLELRVPKLKGALFESAVIERYRRCMVHFMRNVLSKTPPKMVGEICDQSKSMEAWSSSVLRISSVNCGMSISSANSPPLV